MSKKFGKDGVNSTGFGRDGVTNPTNDSAISRLPQNAIVPGVARDDNGHRVGVYGSSQSNAGVYAESQEFIGIVAAGGHLAAQFQGNVETQGDLSVTGNINLKGDCVLQINNADCAEDFDVAGKEKIDPGTVMVLGQEGLLRQSCRAYDKRVVGVISGAGDYKPGIVLDKQHSQGNRLPVALMGKVYCKVDAHYSPVEAGDLLTSSPTAGHAMKADDPSKAFGAVIGKALSPLQEGQALLPILIALQ